MTAKLRRVLAELDAQQAIQLLLDRTRGIAYTTPSLGQIQGPGPRGGFPGGPARIPLTPDITTLMVAKLREKLSPKLASHDGP